ncbi:MAG: methyltransferase domain-containing protein [Bacteroidales bacterium]
MFKESMRSQYKVISQIYSFINEAELTGDNLKYNRLYNKLAWSYNFSQRIYFWFKFGSEKKFREPFLSELDIKDGHKVLEVSTGTADNFRFLNRKADYYGVDISMRMLLQARKHLKRWKINGTLVHCEGENLPFADNYFDVVFHCGGINFFNDKQKAILEMIRVAKPGTKLLIVDETEQLIKENYQKNPFIKGSYTDAKKAAIPVNLIPLEMENIQSNIICKGQIYKITFTKPIK